CAISPPNWWFAYW
nr:immunoglobulin heavy chain junction region [Mus musculus]NSM04681.1 immunoglobulin heavy chain junction region [Mus musculus]NSM05913.1 immunoglobulin heavy chain junction region [Mus musculus]NSM06043.1 immunoglobulin heavy chain junction region [Mus musculus]NSM07328.1 immunoglobulin heavy chain junction region [Mus musculus]